MTIINNAPISQPVQDSNGLISRAWVTWFAQVLRVCFDVQNAGTTAQRPITGLYEGKEYTDLTLVKKIWYISGSWRDNTGAVV